MKVILHVLTIILLCAYVQSKTGRQVTFLNNCKQEIRIGMTGASMKFNADCNALIAQRPECQPLMRDGTMVDCFCGLPGITDEQKNIAPQGSVVVEMPPGASGNVWASTGCKGESCQTGLCPKGYCAPYQGASGPMTLAEFTFGDLDYYDISAIDGMNIPMSMKPNGEAGTGYRCGSAGGASSWNFKDAVMNGRSIAKAVQMVSGGSGAACTADADCGSGESCGMGVANDGKFVCGQLVAYQAAKNLCETKVDWESVGLPKLDCSAKMRQGSLKELLTCSGLFYAKYSGYNGDHPANIGPDVCGCPDWVKAGIDAPTGDGSQCKFNNDQWETEVMPWLMWHKHGAKDVYTFPYDDMTSTYTCFEASTGGGYTITFCPADSEASFFPSGSVPASGYQA